MEAAHLNELIELEESYWWHVAKRRLVVELLRQYAPAPGLLVEGGIGSARNLEEFQGMGYEVAGLDMMDEAIAHAQRRGIEHVCIHDLGEPWPTDQGSVKAVVLLDVLEHMEDPITVMRHAKRVMQKDGAIVFTVPAYGWLMSDWDEKLGHFRRYSGRMLRAQARQAGLSVVRLSHWNAFTLPPAIVKRLVDRALKRDQPAEFPRVSPTVNALLLGCADLERAWLRYLPVPAGLSLVGVLRDPECVSSGAQLRNGDAQ